MNRIKKQRKFPTGDMNASVSDVEFNLAMCSLVERGLMEELLIDGVIHYQITSLGLQVGHHMDSDHRTRN